MVGEIFCPRNQEKIERDMEYNGREKIHTFSFRHDV